MQTIMRCRREKYRDVVIRPGRAPTFRTLGTYQMGIGGPGARRRAIGIEGPGVPGESSANAAGPGAPRYGGRLTQVVVVGCSGHAKVILDILAQSPGLIVAGFVDTYTNANTCCGLPVLGTEEDLIRMLAAGSVDAAVIGIGDNWSRRLIAEKLLGHCPPLCFPKVVHPSALISRDTSIGQGTVVLAGAAINAGSQVGDFCILNTGASLDHDSSMANYSSLAPGVATGGKVHIGLCSAVCIGAVISNDVHVGDYTVIGAGATVLSDIPDSVIAYGTPARTVRNRLPHEQYLRTRPPGA